MSWKLTDGLAHLRAQVNEAFPNRDHASDGTIGDAAHQAETSGHNPDDTAGARPEWNGDSDSTPEVRAWDMDSDLGQPGVTAQEIVDHIRALPNVSSVLRYMIYNRKIYRAANGWKSEAYTGASAHTEHIHFSGAYTQAADNNTSFDYRLGELTDMPLTTADGKTVWQTDIIPNPSFRTDAKTNPATTAYYAVGDIWNRIGAIQTALAAQSKTIAALASKDDVDEGQIITGILAGLGADQLAAAFTAAGLTPEAIADAIPDNIAQGVVDALGARISAA
jgi:hypothetical protein